MKINKIIQECINELLTEEDYRGAHSAPGPADTNAPLYNLTANFPEDIYGNDALRLYGGTEPYERLTMSIIHSARNKPNKPIGIYRAIPKNLTNVEKIKTYQNHKAYIQKYGKLPKGVDNWKDRSEYYEYISDEIERLSQLPEDTKTKINPGDWVTISLPYAKQHGFSNLNNKYKILSKTVPAKDLWWEGGDINEWGYWPS